MMNNNNKYGILKNCVLRRKCYSMMMMKAEVCIVLHPYKYFPHPEVLLLNNVCVCVYNK